MTAVRAAHIGAQVADGLAAAHARGIVHRDVKPGNILVTDDDTAKVSDFGIARTSGDAQLTRAGIISGTPAYFAPEVARGDDPGPAADVWALGATLYAAVEGRPPYDDRGNPLALLAVIASGTRPHPEHAGILREALNRMFDPDPRSRWSMADAGHVLHRLYERHGPAPTRSITHPVERPVATTAPALFPEPPSTSQPEPPWIEPGSIRPVERQRSGPFMVAALVLLLVVAGVGAYLLFGPEGNASPTSASTEGSDSSSVSARPSQEPPQSTAPSDVAPSTALPTSPSTASPSASPSISEAPSPSAAGSGEQFASTYYGYLPDDTGAGWRSLAPSFRSSIGGRGSYDGFWSTISAVEVTDVDAVEPGVVDVSLTYTKTDGTAEDEVHRLYLQEAGTGYLIVDDDVVG
jgi:eukaryotic-like serine/threonine-protein kinase